MISLANKMATIRRVTFLTTLLFSFIVLCLSAALISVIGQALYFTDASLALATSLLTLLIVGLMFVVDLYRKGTYFSYIIVEVSCLSFLWILWLASGASTAEKDQAIISVSSYESSCTWPLSYTYPSPSYPYPDPTTYGYGIAKINQACHEIKAVIAFSFLTWFLLTFYIVTLLWFAFRARGQGHNIWQTAVRDCPLFSPGDSEKAVGGVPQAMAPQPAIYQSYYPPPVQQSPPLSPQSFPSPAQQYISPVPQQSYPSPAQQYIPPPAQQYIPGGGPPAQQSVYAYPARA